jgi:plastocyanin
MRRIIPIAGLGLGLILAMTTAPVPALAGGACRGEPVTDGHGVTVHIKGLCFAPTVLHAKVGDAVTWVNDGPDVHTVSGANVSFGDYSELAPGKQVTYRFTTSGAYPYYCFLHAGMVGTLVVGDGAGPGAATGSIAESFSRRPPLVTPARVAVVEKSSSGGQNPMLLLIAAVIVAGAAVGGFVLGRRRPS